MQKLKFDIFNILSTSVPAFNILETSFADHDYIKLFYWANIRSIHFPNLSTEISHISSTEYQPDYKAIKVMTMMLQLCLLFFFIFLAAVWLKKYEESLRQLQILLFWTYLPNLIKNWKQTVTSFHTAFCSCHVLTSRQKEADVLAVIILHQQVLPSTAAGLLRDSQWATKAACSLHFNISFVSWFLVTSFPPLLSSCFHWDLLQFSWLDEQKKHRLLSSRMVISEVPVSEHTRW